MSLLLKFLPASRRREGSDDAASVVPEEHVDVKQEKSADSVSEVHQVDGLDSSGPSLEERACCFPDLRRVCRSSQYDGSYGRRDGPTSWRLQLHAPHVSSQMSFPGAGASADHSCSLHSVGKMIGSGIFSTPSSILGSVGSVGASLMLWILGFILSFCGLFIWLEFGTMIPRSGGEKVYLEAVYKKPKYLATVIFASNAILLGFTASGCIVSSHRDPR